MTSRATSPGRLAVTCLAAALAALAAAAPANPAPASPAAANPAPAPGMPRPPACVLGRLSPAHASVERGAIADAQARLAPTLRGLSPRARTDAERRFATELAAYLYGYPIVIVRRTILSFPRNLLVSVASLTTPATQAVVAPNHDTLYSVAQIDLSDGPIVIHAPPTDGRYSVIQLLDGFTNVLGHLGAGASARTGETAAILPPGWRGTLPAGVTPIRSDTRLVWLLGRTLATGRADTHAAAQLLARSSLTPLAAYETGARTPPLLLHRFPARPPVRPPAGAAFFDELGADLAADPPPAADRCALTAFARVGIGAGATPSRTLAGAAADTLRAAATAGPRLLATLSEQVRRELARRLDGWATTPVDTGRFGTGYLDRATVAAYGLGADTNRSALYLVADRDARGRPLTGARTYAVRFARGALPPARAFWSLTLYDARLLLYANRSRRYAIGDRTSGLRHDAAGGLTIVVSHRPPRGPERRNWLPAPPGRFSLYLRLFEPGAAAIHRRWRPPTVVALRAR